MKLQNNLPVVAFCVLVILIILAGPLMGLMHATHLDPSTIAVAIGIVAAACVVFVLFKPNISGMIGAARRRLAQFEDTVIDEYPALPPGRPLLEDEGYDLQEEETRDESQAPEADIASGEPVLSLAVNCPLPVSSALSNSLILEYPGGGRPGRTIATRLFAELFGQLSVTQLIVTRNPSYVSLLPFFGNGWLAGFAGAREERLTHLQRFAQQMPGLEQHFASVNEQNARNFGAKMLEAGAQVVFDAGTYPDLDLASRVLLRLLMSIQEQSSPCIITITEAARWLPNDTWLSQGYGMTPDLQLAQQFRAFVGKMMTQGEKTIYLSTEHVMSMDLRLVRSCHLWLLNRVPAEEDLLFLLHHSGIAESGLACLDRRAIITDTTTRTAMEVALYPHQSAHKETEQRNTSGLLLDLSTIAEEASLGKSTAEDDEQGTGEEREEGESSSAVAGRPTRAFTKQQLAFGVALLLAGQLSETALRRPPTTKVVGDTQITFADLAQELRLRNAFSDRDLLGHDRAEELDVTVRNLSNEERQECEVEILAALAAIAERRGYPASNSSAPLVQISQSTIPSRWPLPSTDIFRQPAVQQTISKEEVWAMARKIQGLLNGQKVYAEVLEEYISIGSTVLQFGVLPTGVPLKDKDDRIARDPGGAILYEKETRVEAITKLKKDLMARLAATQILIQDPVPGTPFVGIQIPNPRPTPVLLRDVLEDPEYRRARLKSKLVIALGRNIAGQVRFLDLEKSFTPHLLVAGSTGGGKSVCLNTIIASILTGATPDEVRMIMIDPKRVELKIYSGIPHVLGDVITDLEKAAGALQRAVGEMERRYRRLEELEVRDLAGYRRLRNEALARGDFSLENIPSLVIIVDELANLMAQVGDEVEELICKIAALGRASGIHLILATQRPTVKVITGDIKNNIPARIAFLVGAAVDSVTILGQGGAEALQGKGDMLFDSPETDAPERIQCALTEDQEAKDLAQYWKQARPLTGEESMQPINPDEYHQIPLSLDLDAQWATSIAESPEREDHPQSLTEQGGEEEADLERAKELIRNEGKASISLLQRRMRIGYTKAARLIDLLEEQGFIGPEAKGGKTRAILLATVTATTEPGEEGE